MHVLIMTQLIHHESINKCQLVSVRMQRDAGISIICQLASIMLHIFHCACVNRPFFTSGLKSDVTVVFLHPDFLKCAKISTIGILLRQI